MSSQIQVSKTRQRFKSSHSVFSNQCVLIGLVPWFFRWFVFLFGRPHAKHRTRTICEQNKSYWIPQNILCICISHRKYIRTHNSDTQTLKIELHSVPTISNTVKIRLYIYANYHLDFEYKIKNLRIRNGAQLCIYLPADNVFRTHNVRTAYITLMLCDERTYSICICIRYIQYSDFVLSIITIVFLHCLVRC